MLMQMTSRGKELNRSARKGTHDGTSIHYKSHVDVRLSDFKNPQQEPPSKKNPKHTFKSITYKDPNAFTSRCSPHDIAKMTHCAPFGEFRFLKVFLCDPKDIHEDEKEGGNEDCDPPPSCEL